MDARFVGITDLAETPAVAVVVDVMRAFTVAAWAFARGAEKIILAESLEEALALKAGHPQWLALKDGPASPEFDAVNSPGLLRTLELGGRTVVQKTTAGTVGALAVKDASLVLCASFVVAEATAQLLRVRACDSATFVVTGEEGNAEEDLACAQYIAGMVGARMDAAEFLQRAADSRAAAELAQGVRGGAHPDDVALCLELDRFSFAMVATLEDSLMVLRPCADPAAVPASHGATLDGVRSQARIAGMDGAAAVGQGELGVARGQCAPVLEGVEGPFDDVAAPRRGTGQPTSWQCEG